MVFFHDQLGLNFRNRFAEEKGFVVLMVRPADMVRVWKDSMEAQGEPDYADVTSSRPNHIAKREHYKRKIGSGETVEMPHVLCNAEGEISIADGRHRLVIFEKAAKKKPDLVVPIVTDDDSGRRLLEKLQSQKEAPEQGIKKQDLLSRLLGRQQPQQFTGRG